MIVPIKKTASKHKVRNGKNDTMSFLVFVATGRRVKTTIYYFNRVYDYNCQFYKTIYFSVVYGRKSQLYKSTLTYP